MATILRQFGRIEVGNSNRRLLQLGRAPFRRHHHFLDGFRRVRRRKLNRCGLHGVAAGARKRQCRHCAVESQRRCRGKQTPPRVRAG